jgi:hypothetical protein
MVSLREMTSRDSGSLSRSLCPLSPTLTYICRDFCWHQPSLTNLDKAKGPTDTLRCSWRPCKASQASGWLCRRFTPDTRPLQTKIWARFFHFSGSSARICYLRHKSRHFLAQPHLHWPLPHPGTRRERTTVGVTRITAIGAGSTALAASSSSSAVPTPEHLVALNEIIRLQGMLAGLMSNSPSYSAYNELPEPFTMPVSTSLSTEGRVRPYYCWLHGHNNTHNGISCKVMAANPAYTGAMKAASSHVGSGGNPKVRVICFTTES